MKDKEKRIEEMFQDVAKVMCDCDDKERFFRPHRYGCRNCYMHTVIQHIVYFLRNSNYKKLPEDSVVISKKDVKTYQEIYDFMKEFNLVSAEETKTFIKFWQKTYKNRWEREKEVAEKYSRGVVKFTKDIFNIGQIDFKAKIELLKENEKLAKQFGVELKQ